MTIVSNYHVITDPEVTLALSAGEREHTFRFDAPDVRQVGHAIFLMKAEGMATNLITPEITLNGSVISNERIHTTQELTLHEVFDASLLRETGNTLEVSIADESIFQGIQVSDIVIFYRTLVRGFFQLSSSKPLLRRTTAALRSSSLARRLGLPRRNRGHLGPV